MSIKARHSGTLGDWQPKNPTTQMPPTFVHWVEDNKARWQQHGKRPPFFIRDNYKQGDVDKGLDSRITDELTQAQLAIQQAKKPKVEPITDYDNILEPLRKQAAHYNLDLSEIETIRAGGNPADSRKLLQLIGDKLKEAETREEEMKREKAWTE